MFPTLPPASSPLPGLHDGLTSWNPLVISLVVTICVAFLVLSYFTILEQMPSWMSYYSRNPIPSAPHDLLNEANNPDEFQSHGLDSFTVKSLPVVRFESNGTGPVLLKNSEYAVCLGEFEQGEQLKFLPYCSHAFHVLCIDEWFECHSTCPMCGSDVFGVTSSEGCSISMHSLIETMRREDFVRDMNRSDPIQSIRFEILRNA